MDDAAAAPTTGAGVVGGSSQTYDDIINDQKTLHGYANPAFGTPLVAALLREDSRLRGGLHCGDSRRGGHRRSVKDRRGPPRLPRATRLAVYPAQLQ